ncbi:MAG: hypothetical protein NWE93_10815 [Candidatus Bathyarchaeota archaeon]|nr:hypothetical protein [Candidatus Bathyarchaeota archaeon]
MKKPFILENPQTRRAKCKFSTTCELFSQTSHTCMHTGGNYCGRYRRLNDELKAGPEFGNGYLTQTSQ